MGKRFKGGTCAYCGERGETADHVFARKFFPTAHRGDLPQVAACETCNRSKSEIEHYLLTVLPFAGQHPAFPELLVQSVPRRLAKNLKLGRELAAGRIDVSWEEDGSPQTSPAIPFESERLFAYMRYVARGLVCVHWNYLIPSAYVVSAGLVDARQEAVLKSLFTLRGNGYARGNLGNGLLLYEGQQAVDDPGRSIWRFQVYGGMRFGGDGQTVLKISPDLWAVTDTHVMPGLSPDPSTSAKMRGI